MARKTVRRNKPKAQPEKEQVHRLTRRVTLGKIAAYGVGGVVLSSGVGAFALDLREKLIEQDLSAIGQGTPVILQIHDPQCSMCTALQRQARRALRAIEDDAVLYRVADIHTEEGAAHQRREGLPHVTLVLYDGSGKRVHVIEGVTPADELIEAFRRYLRVPLA